jgi:hypothetical protein
VPRLVGRRRSRVHRRLRQRIQGLPAIQWLTWHGDAGTVRCCLVLVVAARLLFL